MRERIVLVALSLSTFLYVTTETLPIGLLPQIAGGLGSTTAAIGLLVTAYGLVVVVASVPLTRLTRRLPRRRLLSVLLGVFVLATAAGALAPGYRSLLAARVVTALSQALFWAVVTPAAAGLVRAEVRGRALSLLFAGSSVAALAGVPAGTWLGQQAGWRVPFLALSALGLLVLTTIAVLMPDTAPGHGDADHGSAPDAGRYWSMVVATALTVTGAFAAFTYVSPFLTGVTGLAGSATGPVLLIRGLAGLAGVVLAGLMVDRNGWLTMVLLIGAQAVALAGQFVFGASTAGAVVTIAAAGFTLAALSAALGARVLEVAPGGSDMAAAGISTSFNVGITGGALLGSVLLTSAGVRSTALAGAALSLAALAVVLAEPAMARAGDRHVTTAREFAIRPR
jgi:MFS transporter, DHA1 family, inner membrane transport protein